MPMKPNMLNCVDDKVEVEVKGIKYMDIDYIVDGARSVLMLPWL